MTRKELKAHCLKQIESCEMWARCKVEEPHGKVYEEHKLILELLEQEPRWIFVSERLPEIHNYSDNYLVTLKCGVVRTAMFTECDGKNWWTYDDVEAWLPLPKPANYKE